MLTVSLRSLGDDMIGSLDENKALVRRYFEEIANQGKLAVAEEIITPEHITDIQSLTRKLRAAFPDFHITVEDQIAEGDMVATIFTATGTHRGVWQSQIGPIPATGKRFSHGGVRVFRISGGKLVDTWGGADTIAQMQQLGVLPTPSGGAG